MEAVLFFAGKDIRVLGSMFGAVASVQFMYEFNVGYFKS